MAVNFNTGSIAEKIKSRKQRPYGSAASVIKSAASKVSGMLPSGNNKLGQKTAVSGIRG